MFTELKHHQWGQSWHTWDGDIETLRHHVSSQLHSYSCKEDKSNTVRQAMFKTMALKTQDRGHLRDSKCPYSYQNSFRMYI